MTGAICDLNERYSQIGGEEHLSVLNRRTLLFGGVLASGLLILPTRASAEWRRLPTEPYTGKQDDIFFISREIGWYGNGKGKIFKTTDGGLSWRKVLDQPGTFVRSLGFIDADCGVMGNVGPGSFPNVTDPHPLYRTIDGGLSWSPVISIDGPVPQGICAIDILSYPFINAGVLERRPTMYAAGRVGGPAHFLTSKDRGLSWTSRDLTASTGMILDVKFLDERIGFIAGCSDANVENSHARVLKTVDGGKSWRIVYESQRPWEITWKLAFPSRSTGYVTVQSYNPDQKVTQRFVTKTDDGGDTWHELPLIADPSFTEFGIGFVNERRGWVGGTHGGLQTSDGGRSWKPADIGTAVNKIRVVRDSQGVMVAAIGSEVRLLDLPS